MVKIPCELCGVDDLTVIRLGAPYDMCFVCVECIMRISEKLDPGEASAWPEIQRRIYVLRLQEFYAYKAQL